MKVAHNDQENKETRKNNRSAYWQWKWWLGFWLMFAA